MRIFRFSGVVGNDGIINIIRKSLQSHNFPKFSIFYGDSGVGKSTCAEISSLYLTCSNPSDGEPCLECDNCKRSIMSISKNDYNGMSSRVRKVNLSHLANKSELGSLIESIFKIDRGNENTVFILEEPQTLPEIYQSALLEEIERIPDNVYVMMCTTKMGKLLPDIRNRAIKYRFTTLDNKSARLLVDRVCSDSSGFLTDKIKNKIITFSRGVPREITNNTLNIIRNNLNDDESVEALFNLISYDKIRILLKSSTDLSEFLKQLEDLLKEFQVSDLVSNIKSYLLESAFLAKDLSFRETVLSSADKSFAKELGIKPILEIYNLLYKLPYGVSNEDFTFSMILCSKIVDKQLRLNHSSDEIPVTSSKSKEREITEITNAQLEKSNAFGSLSMDRIHEKLSKN